MHDDRRFGLHCIVAGPLAHSDEAEGFVKPLSPCVAAAHFQDSQAGSAFDSISQGVTEKNPPHSLSPKRRTHGYIENLHLIGHEPCADVAGENRPPRSAVWHFQNKSASP